ncbi:6,7-dimethyl-8-ribityllumazine synthase [Nymphon striatum]|nr:6,7-dimethyl-8-ribityllumazine synthase [Nymphon striatum]
MQGIGSMTDKKKIAFIKARWHAEIVDQSFKGFCDAIAERDEVVISFDVPGAFEMPLLAKKLAKTGEYCAIVCAAFVVDGGIYRHEFVSQTVVDGLMKVQLETEVPVFSVSLTPHNFQSTQEHLAFFSEHFVKKGNEAANAVKMLLDMNI